jgi:hypothetical protein
MQLPPSCQAPAPAAAAGDQRFVIRGRDRFQRREKPEATVQKPFEGPRSEEVEGRRAAAAVI